MVVDRVMAKAVDNYLPLSWGWRPWTIETLPGQRLTEAVKNANTTITCSYKSAENFFQLSNFEPITSIFTAQAALLLLWFRFRYKFMETTNNNMAWRRLQSRSKQKLRFFIRQIHRTKRRKNTQKMQIIPMDYTTKKVEMVRAYASTARSRRHTDTRHDTPLPLPLPLPLPHHHTSKNQEFRIDLA